MAGTRSRTDHGDGSGIDGVVGKRRWTEAEARIVVEAQRGSSLSLRAFARRHGLSVQRLYDWRRRLAAGVAPRFLPVTLKSATAPSPDAGTVTILLRGGRAVRVAPGFDGRTLAGVVEVLENLPC